MRPATSTSSVRVGPDAPSRHQPEGASGFSHFRRLPSLPQSLQPAYRDGYKNLRDESSSPEFTETTIYQESAFAMHAQPVLRSNRVSAVFQDATMLVMDLDREATLGQLAEEIGELAKFHGGLFLPVHVRLARHHRPIDRWLH
jgi:hypothetical protein